MPSENVAMATILSEFSESHREVMLDLYEGNMKAWHEFSFVLSTNIGRYVLKSEKKSGCHDNNFCHCYKHAA